MYCQGNGNRSPTMHHAISLLPVIYKAKRRDVGENPKGKKEIWESREMS